MMDLANRVDRMGVEDTEDLMASNLYNWYESSFAKLMWVAACRVKITVMIVNTEEK